MELRWVASLSATCIHVADAIARNGKLVDSQWSTAISDPAIALIDEIRTSGLPEPFLWRNLAAFAHQIENNRELVTTAIRRTVGGAAKHDALTSRLASRIGALESAVLQIAPQLIDDLAHRGRPMREAWESYGPGVLRSIGTLTDERLLVPNAEVVLVHPVQGGGGAAQLLNNSVRLEAVLTNNVPQLPEPLRLGWLLAQLNYDLPAFGESIPADHLPVIAQWAMLPAVLQVAQELEIAQLDQATLSLAASTWRVEQPFFQGIDETIWLWWQTYTETQPPWTIALAALDKMIYNPPSE